MAVGGDSAGGTLAASCAILARDAGLPLALQLLIYPGTTAHQDTDSHETFAHGLLLEKEGIAWFFSNYVRDDADRADWRFAPLLAPDVDGVARPGSAWPSDPLVDEGVAYADKLRMAGVAVDLEIYRGVTHEFIKMGRAIPEARQAQADAAKALKRLWAHTESQHFPFLFVRIAMQLEDFRCKHRLVVRWSEVDAQRIVFNAHYMMYADVGHRILAPGGHAL
jgi:acetyl esterase